MNTTQFFIFFAVAAIIGIIFAIYAFKRPTIIKFSYCPVEWIEPILLSGALFMAVFLIELPGVQKDRFILEYKDYSGGEK